MKNRFNDFFALHHDTEPLLVGNAWDAQSAKILEQHFKAIGTSSAAVASSLGYSDGQEMSFEEYTYVVKRIMASTTAPLTVDLEAGYGNTAEEICANITFLNSIGVSGINIEDSVVNDGNRTITDPLAFSEKLAKICRLLKDEDIDMFINVRSDSFLLNLPNALEDALLRIDLYQQTGVHGLFFPCVTSIADIETLASASALPVNVMCMPSLPDFSKLQQAGVKRISAGPFLSTNVYQKLENSVEQIITEGNFSSLF